MRRFVAGLSVAYGLALAAVVAAIYYFGDGWWPLVVVQYLPRVGFALPLLVLVPAALGWRSWTATVSLLGALGLVLFPLMRLNLAGPKTASGPTVRFMTFNVYFGWRGLEGLRREIETAHPDLLVLEASNDEVEAGLKPALRAMGLQVQADDEFLIASRYPIKERWLAPPFGKHRPAMFARYLVDTPLGAVDVFVTHPFSPRRGFEELRGEGLRTTLVEGPPPEAGGAVERNAEMRALQVHTLLDAVKASRHPVIVAGDTNLPGLGPLDRALTEHLRDGFEEVGLGFGYTFPAHRLRPWMRIDRVLTGEQLRVTSLQVVAGSASDHAAVVAEIAAR